MFEDDALIQDELLTQVQLEKLFMEYVIECRYGPGDPSGEPNAEAIALFSAIEQAFLDCQDEPLDRHRWVTDGQLVQLMAAYLRKELTGSLGDDPTILNRIRSAFVRTLVTAIRASALRSVLDKTYFRAFPLPGWFINWANPSAK